MPPKGQVHGHPDALATGVIAGATLIPNAEPIAQVVDAGGEE